MNADTDADAAKDANKMNPRMMRKLTKSKKRAERARSQKKLKEQPKNEIT